MNNTTLNSLATPTSPVTIRVRIDDIQAYEHSPRRAPNELYEEIRESIRTVGLQQQISITKRPNENHYIVRSGGNTRLKALKELYAETGEERFAAIDCRFVPYTCESELLSLHLMENEQFAKLLFIDSAMAVKNFKTMIEEKVGKTISLRQLTDEMNQRGWRVNPQYLPYYLYATEIANELPIAFAHGLDRTYVIFIKMLGRRVEHWADDKNININQCIQVFKNTLKKNDGKLISISVIEEELIESLSSTYKLNFNDVKNDFILIRNKETPIKDGVTNNG